MRGIGGQEMFPVSASDEALSPRPGIYVHSMMEQHNICTGRYVFIIDDLNIYTKLWNE